MTYIRALVFFGLSGLTFASATLDALVNAATRFSGDIAQQLVIVQNVPALADFAQRTIEYAEAKTAYIMALRDEMPQLINIARRRKLHPLQLDNFIAAYSIEKLEKAADEKTVALLERLSDNPIIQKARAEFERAQKTEETFHKDFDGIDLTSRGS
jgi:hypothetical protein